MKESKLFIKKYIISTIFFLIFSQVMIFIFLDGVGGFANDGVSGFIEQANLQNALGDWYQLVFWTDQVNLCCATLGMLYFIFYKNQIYKNLLFCSISYMLFCLFAISVFSWDSFSYNPYESAKTLLFHFINPLVSFIILFWIKNEILLSYKIMIYCSFYVTFYYILALIIYYNFNFTENANEDLRGNHLWIYGFLDFNNQLMFVPTKNIIARFFVVGFGLLLTPIIGFLDFIFIKFIFNVRIQNIQSFLMKKHLVKNNEKQILLNK